MINSALPEVNLEVVKFNNAGKTHGILIETGKYQCNFEIDHSWGTIS